MPRVPPFDRPATHAGNEVVRAEPFEAIELERAALWGDAGDGPLSSV